MPDSTFEQLAKLYYELSDIYFDVSEEETSQEERDALYDACEGIMSVLSAHADTPDREKLLP